MYTWGHSYETRHSLKKRVQQTFANSKIVGRIVSQILNHSKYIQGERKWKISECAWIPSKTNKETGKIREVTACIWYKHNKNNLTIRPSMPSTEKIRWIWSECNKRKCEDDVHMLPYEKYPHCLAAVTCSTIKMYHTSFPQASAERVGELVNSHDTSPTEHMENNHQNSFICTSPLSFSLLLKSPHLRSQCLLHHLSGLHLCSRLWIRSIWIPSWPVIKHEVT